MQTKIQSMLIEGTDREVGAFFICVCRTDLLSLYCERQRVIEVEAAWKIYLEDN